MERALTHTTLRTLALALGGATAFELALATGESATWLLATLGRLFVLGCSAALLAHVELDDRNGVASRPLVTAVFLSLLAALIHVVGDAATALSAGTLAPPAQLLFGMADAFLSLMALTLLTVALTPMRGAGISLVVVSSLLAFASPALVFATFAGGDGTTGAIVVRAGATAVAFIACVSRISIFERTTGLSPDHHPQPGSSRSAMALAPEPLWREALLGARLLRAAELTRLLAMLLVFLIGFALLPLGPSGLVPLLIGQSLALVFIALTALIGFIRFSKVPHASGARAPALAGLVLAVVTFIQVLGAAAVDLALVLGQHRLGSSLALDTSARFSTLGTLVAVCLAIIAIARRAHQPLLARSALLAGVLYLAATVALTGADGLGASHSMAAVMLKLAALLLFTAGFTRLVRILTEVGPLMEAERRKALGSEFA
jgi:hypothetical protein